MTRDTLAEIIIAKRQEAQARTFGVTDFRREAAVRHGYLLALEEVERALDELHAPLATSSPRDAA
jgi:hypothetical protein